MGFGKRRQWCGVCTYRGMVWSSRKVILYSATSSRGHVGNETRSCAVRGSESPSHKWGGRVPPPLGSAPLPSHDHHSPCHNSPSPLILTPSNMKYIPFLYCLYCSCPPPVLHLLLALLDGSLLVRRPHLQDLLLLGRVVDGVGVMFMFCREENGWE